MGEYLRKFRCRIALGVTIIGCVGCNTATPPPPPLPPAQTQVQAPAAEESPTRIKPSSIAQIQRVLQENGFDVTADGRMGPNTKTALTKFQMKNGLEPTGLADRATRQKMGLR